MELKNMQTSAKAVEAATAPKASDAPRYPWGLQLHLDAEQLEKLDMGKVPEVGSTVMVHALATVTSRSEREEQDGDKQRSADLQITDMAVMAPSDMPNAADVLYRKA